MSGIPVQMEALEAQLYYDGTWGYAYGEEEVSDLDRTQYIKKIEALNRPILDDQLLLNIVLEQLESYINGQISLKKCVINIVKKGELYYAESN